MENTLVLDLNGNEPSDRQRQRRRGACLLCFQRKRRCDQQKPACSQCVRQGVRCELQRFKQWDPNRRPGKRTWTLSDRITELADDDDGGGDQQQQQQQRLQQRPPAPEQEEELLPEPHQDSLDALLVDFTANVNALASQHPATHDDDDANDGDMPLRQSHDDVILSSSSSHHPSLNVLQSTHASPDLTHLALAVPVEFYLWHHYLTSTANDLMYFENSSAAHFPNPFIDYVPRLAFRHPYLFKATLALAAQHHDRVKNANAFATVSKELSEQAKQSLPDLHGLHASDPDALNAALATVLIICMCQIHTSEVKEWYAQLQLARMFARKTLSLHETLPPSTGGKVIETLISILCYLEIVPSISFGTFQECAVVDRSFDELQSQIALVSHGIRAGQTQHFTVDPILLFSPRLVFPIIKLGQSIQQRKSSNLNVLDPALPAFDSQAPTDEWDLQLIEETLLEAEEADQNEMLCGNDNDDARLCNEAMHAVAFLLFYTRLRNIPYTSKIVRRSVKRVMAAAQAIHPDAKANPALVPALVIAGCESVDAADRLYVTERLQGMRESSLCDIDRILQMLSKIWSLRDEDPLLCGIDWQLQIEREFGGCLVY